MESIIESKGDERPKNTVSGSNQVSLSGRFYYHNQSNEYRRYTLKEQADYRSSFGIINDTMPDLESQITDENAESLEGLFKRKPSISDNFNGDLYLITYRIDIFISPEFGYQSQYGVMLQNGKTPEKVPVIPSIERAYRTAKSIHHEHDIAHEMTEITGNLNEWFFELSLEPLNEDIKERVRKWNEYYMDRYRKHKEYIPLKTFGGKPLNRPKFNWKLLLCIIMILTLIVIYLIHYVCDDYDYSYSESFNDI